MALDRITADETPLLAPIIILPALYQTSPLMLLEEIRALLVSEARYTYNAEIQLYKALPVLADSALNPQLKRFLLDRVEDTKKHIQLLESVTEILRISGSRTCYAMLGLLKESMPTVDCRPPSDIYDARIINALQHIETWQNVSYETFYWYADKLNETRAAGLFRALLDEKGERDSKLRAILHAIIDNRP